MRSGRDNVRSQRRVTVRLSEAEAERLDALCAPTPHRGALSPSAVIRAALADALSDGRRDEVGPHTDLDDPACSGVHVSPGEAHRLRVAVTRVGTNLNQIARGVNDGSVTSIDDESRATLREVDALVREIHTALGGAASS